MNTAHLRARSRNCWTIAIRYMAKQLQRETWGRNAFRKDFRESQDRQVAKMLPSDLEFKLHLYLRSIKCNS